MITTYNPGTTRKLRRYELLELYYVAACGGTEGNKLYIDQEHFTIETRPEYDGQECIVHTNDGEVWAVVGDTETWCNEWFKDYAQWTGWAIPAYDLATYPAPYLRRDDNV